MAVPIESPATETAGDRTTPAWTVIRWVGLLTLLGAEIMVLTLRFDTGSLTGTDWWLAPLEHSPEIFRLGSLIALTTLGLNWPYLRRNFAALLEQCRTQVHWQAALFGHIAAMAIFYGLSSQLLEHEGASSTFGPLWILAWLLAGSLTLGLWAAALLPIALWYTLARRTLLAGILIGGAAWTAAFLAQSLWRPLGYGTFWLVAQLLGLMTADVVVQPEQYIVGTTAFQVHIAPSCSGYEGIGLVVVFLSAYLWIARATLRFPHALMLVPIAAMLIWLANAVRIAALIVIGTWGSPEVALGGFHSQAGWLAFIGVSLGMIAVTRRLRLFSRSAVDADSENPAAPYLVPLLAILATAMITGAFTHGFDWLYPARVLIAGIALWYFRRSYTELSLEWSWTAVALGTLVYGLWLAFEFAFTGLTGGDELAEGLNGLSRGSAFLWIIFRVVGSVVTVPLAEELAFRGFVNRRLIAEDFEQVPIGKFTWFSLIVTSVAFGVLHQRWIAGTIAGVLYALILARRGRLSDAVLAHATTNALIAVHVLTTGTWSLWS